MKLPNLTPIEAVLWGGLIAGVLDIGAVFAYWAAHGVGPAGIARGIATSLMGPAAYEAGNAAVLLGMVLHFFVSFTFAAAYVGLARRLPVLITHPLICGPAYGALAKVVMGQIVVPLSRATFGQETPSLEQAVISWLIHILLFGLPIALTAARMRPRS
jgi:uncharacterized membrane protein YagU involved in acid resistance